MSLSLKAELETWAAALKSYDEQDFERALQQFSVSHLFPQGHRHVIFTFQNQQIADSSKILTNMGLIYATIGEHEAAVEHFNAATNLDSYLSIA
jgi:tetratricopeptide (TPR) repeat protein